MKTPQLNKPEFDGNPTTLQQGDFLAYKEGEAHFEIIRGVDQTNLLTKEGSTRFMLPMAMILDEMLDIVHLLCEVSGLTFEQLPSQTSKGERDRHLFVLR